MAPTNKKRLRDNDQDSDYENERSYNCNNWPRFLVVELSSDDLLLSKLSPFAIQKGFQAVAGTLKSIKMLRDGSWKSVAKGPRPKTYSEQTDLSTDQSEPLFTRP